MDQNKVFVKIRPYAFFLMLFPVVYVCILFLLFSFSVLLDILSSFLVYFLFFGIVFSGYGFWKFRRWSWYVFMVCQGLLSLHFLFLIDFLDHQGRWALFFLFFFLQVFLMFRISKIIRVPYIFPRVRWWEHNPKFRGLMPVKIQLKETFFHADLVDLNEQGCFLKIAQVALRQGDSVKIQAQLFSHSFSLSGMVVWVAARAVTRPEGLGIVFSGLTRAQRKDLKMAKKKLAKMNDFYKRNRYFMNTKDFSHELARLEHELLYQHD
jgi:hypothetical protein